MFQEVRLYANADELLGTRGLLFVAFHEHFDFHRRS